MNCLFIAYFGRNEQAISEKREHFFITSETGTGKSWVACALGRQACRMGLSVTYIRLSRLLEELRLSRVDGAYAKILCKLLKVDLLIIDDWRLDRPTKEQRKDILEVVEDRHQAKSLLITSQLPTQKWHEMIAEPTIADAILDRLLEKSLTTPHFLHSTHNQLK